MFRMARHALHSRGCKNSYGRHDERRKRKTCVQHVQPLAARFLLNVSASRHSAHLNPYKLLLVHQRRAALGPVVAVIDQYRVLYGCD